MISFSPEKIAMSDIFTSPAVAYAYTASNPLQLGLGFDSLKGELKGQVLKNNASVAPLTGQAETYRFKLIEHYYEMRRELSLSLSASYGGGGAGVNANLSYESVSTLSSTSICLVAQVNIRQPALTVADSSVSDNVSNLLRNRRNGEIFQIIGDQYIDAISLGGDLYIFLTFEATDSSDYQKLKADLGGSYGAFQGKAGFQQTLSEKTKNRRSEIVLFKSGGVGATPTDLESALKVIDKYAEEVQAKPFPCAIHVSPLTNAIANTGLPASEVPRLGERFDWLLRQARQYDLMTEAANSWKQVLNRPQEFYSPAVTAKATDVISRLENVKIDLENRASNVRADLDFVLPAVTAASAVLGADGQVPPPYVETVEAEHFCGSKRCRHSGCF
jgi:hypothetical protein